MRTGTWKSVAALACLAVLVLAPGTALAQDEAGLAGTVEDATGGVLPGVTVETQSPALLAPRVAVTDFAGNYRLINLPSGTYTVTFTLVGFGTVVREGIVLQGAFVADVDAELTVGAVAETVTVTAAAPLVDVISTRQQSVLTAERVNVLPGAAGIHTASRYVPGVTHTGPAIVQSLPILHGSDPVDGQPAVDGIRTGAQLSGRGEFAGGIGTITNEAMISEIVFDTASQSAEFAQSGLRTNIVPKAGGNNFSFEVFASGTNQNFESDNQSQELKDRGFQFAPTDYIWTINPAAGGPILEDKLWFFASFMESLNKTFILDRFFDLDEPSTPDSVTADDLRAFSSGFSGQQTVRITHQLTQRNKLTYSFLNHRSGEDLDNVEFFGRHTPEALHDFNTNPTYMLSARWTAPVTSQLLVEVDAAFQETQVNTFPRDHGEFRMPKSDVALGTAYHSSFQNHHATDYHRRMNASLSYVTGSHNFKAGVNYANNRADLAYTGPGDMFLGLLFNGAPLGVLVTGNGEIQNGIRMDCDCGVYAQDAWTLDRLTLNGGVRFDWFSNSVPGGFRPAGFFAPELTLPDPLIEDVPSWQNWNGRFGGAFDLFGDGLTAVKASVGRYVAHEQTGLTQGFSPIHPYSNLDFRSWSDLNGDNTAMNPDGTPQFDEIGPSANPNFGTAVIQTTLDPLAPRGTNWEYSAGIERQLGPGWAVSGMWHRRSYSNFRWTDNLNNSSDDYYLAGTFTGPTDPDLPPSARGVQVPIYNLKEGRVITGGNDYLTGAAEDWRTWNGFEVILDGELPRGGFMTASFTAGTSKNSFCQSGNLVTGDNPNNLVNCDTTSPYRPMGKLSGALPLPWDTMISGLFQVFAGVPLNATYQVNADDFPGLDFGPGQDPTLTVNLIEPGTAFEEYKTDLALRFSKVITVRDVRTRVYMDANNLFNQARVTTRNRFYGGGGVKNPDFLRLIGIEPGRQLSFGVQADF